MIVKGEAYDPLLRHKEHVICINAVNCIIVRGSPAGQAFTLRKNLEWQSNLNENAPYKHLSQNKITQTEMVIGLRGVG